MGFAVGSGIGNGDGGVPIFFLTCQIHCPLSGISSHSAVTSPQGADSALLLSSSEEVDVKSADYLPPQSPQYEELLEVVTRAFAKLNIDWPAEKKTQPHRGVNDRGRNHSWPVYSSTASDYYGNVAGLRLCGAEMPRVEQMLAGYLSPGAASSLKAPVLPSKPLCATSALVGKRYTAAGQAGACLQTTSVLQAHQADLLK